jgi:hypothetical protein
MIFLPRSACGEREVSGASRTTGHLVGAGHAIAQQADDEEQRGVDRIIIGREQAAFEQREVQEAHRHAEDQRIADQLPPRPPGDRDRAAGQPGRAAAEKERDQQEHAERSFFVKIPLH